ncbi:MAG: SagB/ThcOx family dehydrogenase [Anaerolineae bacterium]
MTKDPLPDQVAMIIAYHQATKHHFHAFAPGPGYLDWANQPDPFRRYAGAPVIPLQRIPPDEMPPYEAGFAPGLVPSAPLDYSSVSRLFFDALALSAWKEYGGSRWALRVNPSSGNLHPTEGYLICGRVPGLCEAPILAHYTPVEHALEVRARLSERIWQDLREGVALEEGSGLPEGTIFVGLTSIHWREAWKYGERAYRYCQHDVGHALAALSIAASGLGWEARLLDSLSSDELAALLGVSDPRGAEPEHPDCLVAVYPQGWPFRRWQAPTSVIEIFRHLGLSGQPNRLSRSHVAWRWVEAAAEIAKKPAMRELANQRIGESANRRISESANQRISESANRRIGESAARSTQSVPQPLSLRRIIHQRRSAVAMDGTTAIDADVFYRILARTLPGAGAPFALLPWPSQVDLALFVHRVRGLEPGLYLLARAPARIDALRAAMRPEFNWAQPADCPADLPLYLLARGDLRRIAQRLSCGQDIAADGCFSLGMIAEFEGPLQERGAWFYPRLFWECGMIGQVLYLEAEAAGVRGTGIGCFFDDGVHDFLGLRGQQFQSLYHFTVGGPVEDPRLTTLPAYPPLQTRD